MLYLLIFLTHFKYTLQTLFVKNKCRLKYRDKKKYAGRLVDKWNFRSYVVSCKRDNDVANAGEPSRQSGQDGIGRDSSKTASEKRTGELSFLKCHDAFALVSLTISSPD